MLDYTTFALRFLSGKYEGSEYPLKKNQTISIGRGTNLDLVLIEDMVSRHHCKLICGESNVQLQDLGSTNGTFVNGERIRQIELKQNDRILIGTVILQVIPTTSQSVKLFESSYDSIQDYSDDLGFLPAPKEEQATIGLSGITDGELDNSLWSALEKPASSSNLSSVSDDFIPSWLPYASEFQVGPILEGTLEETSLEELVDLFVSTRKSGVLVVTTKDSEGRIHVRQGAFVCASCNGKKLPNVQKVATRIFTWQQAKFAFFPPNDEDAHTSLNESLHAIYKEASQFEKKLQPIREFVPASTNSFHLMKPLGSPLRELSPEFLDFLQIVWNEERLANILDESSFTDLETYQKLAYLVRHNYLQCK